MRTGGPRDVSAANFLCVSGQESVLSTSQLGMRVLFVVYYRLSYSANWLMMYRPGGQDVKGGVELLRSLCPFNVYMNAYARAYRLMRESNELEVP